MAVIMIAEAPGADASFIHGCAAGVADTLVQAPGFVSHISGAGSNGYRVIEVWEVPEGPPGLVRRPRRAEPTARHWAYPLQVHRDAARLNGQLTPSQGRSIATHGTTSTSSIHHNPARSNRCHGSSSRTTYRT